MKIYLVSEAYSQDDDLNEISSYAEAFSKEIYAKTALGMMIRERVEESWEDSGKSKAEIDAEIIHIIESASGYDSNWYRWSDGSNHYAWNIMEVDNPADEKINEIINDRDLSAEEKLAEIGELVKEEE